MSRPAVRWVKVAWLGSLLGRHMAAGIRDGAKRALVAVDNDDPRGLVDALLDIANAAGSTETRRLACDAANAVSGVGEAVAS